MVDILCEWCYSHIGRTDRLLYIFRIGSARDKAMAVNYRSSVMLVCVVMVLLGLLAQTYFTTQK